MPEPPCSNVSPGLVLAIIERQHQETSHPSTVEVEFEFEYWTLCNAGL